MSQPAPEFDCQKCGACCMTFDVLLDYEDEARLRRLRRLDELTFPYERPAWSVRFLRRDDAGKCLSLGGALGACGCTIYEHRPNLCRALQPGDPHCLEARRQHGMDRGDK